MLSYTGKLKVSAADFYNTLVKSVVDDINRKTDKNYTVADLEEKNGIKYRYKHTEKKKTSEFMTHIRVANKNSKVIIGYFENNKSYEMGYDIKALEDELTEVTFYQKEEGQSEGFLAGKMFERDIKKRFRTFEKYIQKTNKENKEKEA